MDFTEIFDYIFRVHFMHKKVIYVFVISKQTLNFHVFPFTYIYTVGMYGTKKTKIRLIM